MWHSTVLRPRGGLQKLTRRQSLNMAMVWSAMLVHTGLEGKAETYHGASYRAQSAVHYREYRR